MIVFRITMHALPEKRKEVVQTLLSLTAPAENEAGCLSFTLFYGMQDKNLLCVLEEWENREKLDNHLKSDIFGVLLGTKSLLCHPHEFCIYTFQHAEGLNAVLTARGKRENRL